MKDEWFRAALTDVSVVAELLSRLKQSSSMPTTSSKPPPSPVLVPLRWGQRLPRSKLSNTVVRKDSTTTTNRYSPTTPLSWSDGAYDESSVSRAPSDLYSASRSKGIINNNTTSSRINKSSTRKRKFANLKERENRLLKERIHLNKELASIHVTLKEQKAMSENFKRFKIDLNGGESRDRIASEESEGERRDFVLPDLNMMPIEEEGEIA